MTEAEKTERGFPVFTEDEIKSLLKGGFPLTCAFCEVGGFDKKGLKFHLVNSCQVFAVCPSVGIW